MTKAEVPGNRRNSPKGERRKAEIIAAAMQAVARAGYEKCTIATIAADVGLTVAGLLHHFPSKDELLIAILEKRDADAREFVERGEKGWTAFLRSIVDMLRDNLDNPGLVAAFALLAVESLHKDHPAADWFANRSTAIVAAISERLQEGIEDGTLEASVDTVSVAYEILAVLDGLQQQWLREKQQVDITGIFATYIERLIEACAENRQKCTAITGS